MLAWLFPLVQSADIMCIHHLCPTCQLAVFAYPLSNCLQCPMLMRRGSGSAGSSSIASPISQCESSRSGVPAMLLHSQQPGSATTHKPMWGGSPMSPLRMSPRTHPFGAPPSPHAHQQQQQPPSPRAAPSPQVHQQPPSPRAQPSPRCAPSPQQRDLPPYPSIMLAGPGASKATVNGPPQHAVNPFASAPNSTQANPIASGSSQISWTGGAAAAPVRGPSQHAAGTNLMQQRTNAPASASAFISAPAPTSAFSSASTPTPTPQLSIGISGSGPSPSHPLKGGPIVPSGPLYQASLSCNAGTGPSGRVHQATLGYSAPTGPPQQPPLASGAPAGAAQAACGGNGAASLSMEDSAFLAPPIGAGGCPTTVNSAGSRLQAGGTAQGEVDFAPWGQGPAGMVGNCQLQTAGKWGNPRVTKAAPTMSTMPKVRLGGGWVGKFGENCFSPSGAACLGK